MGLGQILIPVRAWWFLRIAKNTTIPPDIGRYLSNLKERNQQAVEELERKRQAIVNQGEVDGKTISTEAALRPVLALKEAYDGPNREEYISDLDRFIEEFRKRHGPQIPVAEAYAILKELEGRVAHSSRPLA
jgi:hypothetical protein